MGGVSPFPPAPGTDPTTPPGTDPTTPPVIPPGLLPQAADPWSVYGQMRVANPYLAAINQRFGWDPTGLAQGYDIPATPTWYQPPFAMPRTILPRISGAATGAGTGTGTGTGTTVWDGPSSTYPGLPPEYYLPPSQGVQG